MPPSPIDVLRFWRDAGPDRWFSKDAAFDAECRRLFLPTWEEAGRGALSTWESDADGALGRGFDRAVAPDLRLFFYLPFEHAEDLAAQERSLDLFAALGAPEQLKWAKHHHAIVARFGRFPHRNAVLGRTTTPEEAAYLEEDDFRG